MQSPLHLPPAGLRPLHGCGTAALPHKLLSALHKRLGRLGLLDAGVPCLDGQPVRRPRPMVSGQRGAVTRGDAGDGISCLDLWRPRSILRRGLHIRAGIITYSGLLRFDLPLLHPFTRGWPSCTALSPSSAGAALPVGNRFPFLDPGPFPCRRLLGRGRSCRGLWGRRRIRDARLLVCLPALGGLFLLQKGLYPAPGLIGPTGGSVLDPVSAVVAGLPPLGCLPELSPQALRTIIQPTADKLLRRGLDFFL